MFLRSVVFFLFAINFHFVFADLKGYGLKNEKIDVIIPCHEKDLLTLEMCIEGIKANGNNIRRVIVISSERLTDQAEWFDEKNFSFTKLDIAKAILQDDAQAEAYIKQKGNRTGWIYQQMLKLYAPFVIPGISSNVLALDGDTVFLHPVTFMDPVTQGAFFNTGEEYHVPYFKHAERLIPGFKKLYSDYSGICHHMLFQKSILEDLFETIRSYHQMEPWKAFCACVDHAVLAKSCMSEYEIYFNFALQRTDQVKIRQLKWENVASLKKVFSKKLDGYDYVSCHAWRREKEELRKKDK